MDINIMRLRELVGQLKPPVLYDDIKRTRCTDFDLINTDKGIMKVRCLLDEDGIVVSKTIFEDNCVLQAHTHDETEYILVTKGRLTLLSEGNVITYKTGDCFIIKKGVNHQLIEGNGEIICITLEEEY